MIIRSIFRGVLAGAVLAAALAAAPAGAQERPGPRLMRHLALLSEGGPRIGVSIEDLSAADLARAGASGVLVKEVMRGGPADKASMRPGDIIVELDGERVRSARHFQRLVEESVPGREIRAVIMRDGRRSELRLTPQLQGGRGAMAGPPEDLGAEREYYGEGPFGYGWVFPGTPRDPGGRARLGAAVQPLTPQLGAHFGAREGVLVASVQEGSPGARAGLRAGDVITKVNDRPVRTQQDLVRELQGIPPSGEAALGVVRDRKAMTLKVQLGGEKGMGTVEL